MSFSVLGLLVLMGLLCFWFLRENIWLYFVGIVTDFLFRIGLNFGYSFMSMWLNELKIEYVFMY